MQEVENVLEILKQTKIAIDSENTSQIKKLSDMTIHSASTTGDLDDIAIAIIIYSLGKIFERTDYKTMKGWESFKRISIIAIKTSIEDLENNNIEKFQKDFFIIKSAINKISGKLKKYIEEVFKKAEITKGSRIYEHGISLEKTAKLLGISQYDLQQYTGQTGISEVDLNKTIDEKIRIKWLKEFFK